MNLDRGAGVVTSHDGEEGNGVTALDEAELARGVGAEQVGRHRCRREH
jgi:hypothetical protein